MEPDSAAPSEGIELSSPVVGGGLGIGGGAVVLAVVLGGALVATGYALGRSHTFGASAFFWIGQACIFLPAAGYILSGRGHATSQLLILVSIAGIQASLVWAYSPDAFRFPDELQHLRTARDILAAHGLGVTNPTLPLSPDFPGLEEVTTAITTLSGLSLTASGRIVASCSHMLVPVFLWGAFRALSGSDRIAGLGVLAYCTDPHYGYFDVLWAYGTPGMAFFTLMFRNVTVSFRHHSSRVPVVLAFIPLLITHHLSALAGLLMLVALCIALVFGASRTLARSVISLTLVVLILTAAYVVLIAPATVSYLGQPLAANLSAIFSGSTPTQAQGALHQAPGWEFIVEAIAALLTLGLSGLGILIVWLRSGPRRSIKLFALTALSYLVVLAVRVAAPNGSELSSRALTYAMVVIAPAMAFAFERATRPRVGRNGVLASVLVFGVLIVGTIVAAQPPAWERIPGRFYPAAQESGVDARTFALDHWVTRQRWSPSVDVACDLQACAEIGAASNADPSTDAATMYQTRSLPALNLQIAKITVDYVQTDLRWTRLAPPTGAYWAQDPVVHTHPVPQWVVTRFDHDPLVSRIYDDGDNRMYDTYWVWHR